MRIAVIGATGHIGSLTTTRLERDGHEVVPLSRSTGVDVFTGDGLDDALRGVDSVVDVTNSTATREEETVAFFTRASQHLLAAEARAGVAHHVLLSIAGVHRVRGNAHYAGKRSQEEVVEAGPTPFSIVPATQFHDFAAMVTSWTEVDGVAPVAPLLVQPIAPQDVADVLARVAVGPPQGRHPEIAGPEPHDLVDMARRTHAARGRTIRLLPTWRSGIFGPDMAGEVLLPQADAQLAPTTFEEWLATQAAAEHAGA